MKNFNSIRFLISISIILLMSCSTFAQIYINRDQTWTETEIAIKEDIIISEEATLTIEEGVTLIFQGPYTITVEGSLIANGTIKDPITFTTHVETPYWGGIDFVSGKFSRASVIRGCIFENAQTGEAGGVMRINNSEISILNNVFRNNSVEGYGGAIFVNRVPCLIRGNKFFNNTGGKGGAIFAIRSRSIIENNIIVNNTAEQGGGIYFVESEESVIQGNTIANNIAYIGGGILHEASRDYIINNIIYNNRANEDGHQIYITSIESTSVLYNNDIEGGVENFGGFGYDLYKGYDYKETGNLDEDPQFENPSEKYGFDEKAHLYSWPIESCSPLIDAGTNEFDPYQLDIILNKRDIGKGNDIGAFEIQNPSSLNASIYSVGSRSFCDGGGVLLVGPSGTGLDYQWKKGSSNINGANSKNYFAQTSGAYSLYISEPSSGCDGTSNKITATLYSDTFNIAFSSPGTTVQYNGSNYSVQFSNETSILGDYNFTWLYGNDQSASTNDAIHNYYGYEYDAIYDISLIAENIITGCKDTLTKVDYINCFGGFPYDPCNEYDVNINYGGTQNICEGDSVLLIADGGELSYQWRFNGEDIDGATTNEFYAKENGSYYSVYTSGMIDITPCQEISDSVTYVYYSRTIPELSQIGEINICAEDTVEISVLTSKEDYLWSTGSTDFSIQVTETGTYAVTTVDVQGCVDVSVPLVLGVTLIDAPEICIVTVDSTELKNAVVWEKLYDDRIDYYNIYRQEGSSLYEVMGTRDYELSTIALDPTSDPRVISQKYKISLVDTCGNESVQSSYHKTMNMFVTENTNDGGYSLSWNHYEGFDFASYFIFRGSSEGEVEIIDTIAYDLGTTIYNDITAPVGNITYMIAAYKGTSCSISGKRAMSGPFSQSLSNFDEYLSVGIINDITGYNYTVSPNPFNEKAMINLSIIGDSDVEIDVYNVLGSKVQSIEKSKLSSGTYNYSFEPRSNESIYFLHITVNGKRQVKKLISIN